MRYDYTAETAPPSMRWSYGALAPAPGTEYGDILPVAKRPDGSIGFALPNTVREGLLGVADLLSGLDTGEVTARGAASIGLGGLGAGGMLAPRGALAAGGALPMDHASRMARARAMGFNPDLPLFRGVPTGADPSGFQAVAPWEAVRAGQPPGISVAENPVLASRFSDPQVRSRLGLATSHSPMSRPETRALADRPASGRPAEAPPASPGTIEGGPRVYPLLARFENDAVRLTNYKMFPEIGPQSNWLIREPNQLRSRFARFDPAQRDSDDLLAGVAAPAPTAVPGFNVQEPRPPGLRVDPSIMPNSLRRPEDQEW
jgi:hypothetical protein